MTAARWTALMLGLIALPAGWWFGEGYIHRMSNHAGYHLVAVQDEVGVPFERPRRTIVIVVDGLRRDFAERMDIAKTLGERGQCRVATLEHITVSRPIYAVYSTGLEVHRTGSRNNDETSPLAAESIWEVARQARLTVSATSALSWWGELFPRGFDAYHVLSIDRDVFSAPPTHDLALYHPIDVDEAGHQSGAGSDAYAAEVAQVDREIGAFLEHVDLTKDVVILTSDHGHTDAGGHGGQQTVVLEVLTCFAGRGVRRVPGRPAMRGRTLAPTIAVLTGLRFPRHMRAVEDDLDTVFDIVDLPRAYVGDRRAAVRRFRGENAGFLRAKAGDPSWSAFYRQARRPQIVVGVIGLLMILGAATFVMRWKVLWLLAVYAMTVLGFVILRGSFDYTAVNQRGDFIFDTVLVSLAVGVPAMFVSKPKDHSVLVAVTLALGTFHPVLFGAPLGFPLPSQALLFAPFFLACFVATHGLLVIGRAIVGR